MGKLQVRIAIVIAVMLAALAGTHAAQRAKAHQLRQPDWNRVPYHLGEWQGRDMHFDPVYGGDPADSSLLRAYESMTAPAVIVYAGFHRDLPTSLDYHTPELCYPAWGWAVESGSRCRVGMFRGNWVKANEITVVKDGERRVVVWWYHAGPNPFERRIRQVYRLMMMSMFTGRTDGTIVRVETQIAGESQQAAEARVLQFSRDLLPKLEAALPQ